jgi:hypothetical protein
LEKLMWHLFLFSLFHSCYVQHILRPYPWINVVGNPATVTNKNPNISVLECLPYIRAPDWHRGLRHCKRHRCSSWFKSRLHHIWLWLGIP